MVVRTYLYQESEVEKILNCLHWIIRINWRVMREGRKRKMRERRKRKKKKRREI
jgi:hypothetical protein